MQNLKSVNLKVKAYNQIRKMILLRELKQGEKIFEKDLAETMQMSRTPVREALLILQQEQFVANQDRLGFIVRRPTSEEIEDYFNIREVLERYAAPLIVSKVTDEEIQALEANLAQAEAYYTAGDTENFLLCNGLFQELLLNATHSSLYCRMITTINNITTLLRAMSLRNQDTMLQSLQGHQEIVAAVKSKDIETLMNALVNHLQGFRNDMAFYFLV